MSFFQDIFVIALDLKYYVLQAVTWILPKSLLALIVAAFAPLSAVLWAFLVAYAIDFLLGVTSAIRRGRFNSSGMRRGIFKLTIYMSFIGVVALLERALIGSSSNGWVAEAAVALCAITELLSIIEHCVMLGVPVPGAAVVMVWARKKSELYGINFEHKSTDQVGIARDVFTLIEGVKECRNSVVRSVLSNYLNEWYDWILRQRAEDFDGPADLVWERMKNQLDGVLMAAKDHMQADKVNPEFIKRFYHQWTLHIFTRFNQQVKQAVKSQTLTNAQKQSAVQDALGLMLYRLYSSARKLDSQSDNPFETDPGFVIKLTDSSESRIPAITPTNESR